MTPGQQLEMMLQEALDQPGRFQLYHALEERLRPRGLVDPLLKVLLHWSQSGASEQVSTECHVRAADLLAHSPGRELDAIPYITEALRCDPDRGDAMQIYFELAAENRDLIHDAVALQQTRIDALRATGNTVSMADAYWEMGQFCHDVLEASDDAVVWLQAALEEKPDHISALYTLRMIHLQQGDAATAAALLDREAEAESDLMRKAALLAEAGELFATSLCQLDRGIRMVERAHRIIPNDPETVRLFTALLVQRAKREAQLGDREGMQQSNEQAASLLYEMALSLPPHAALAYTEEALNIVPEHDQAIELLEELCSQTGRTDLLPLRWVRYLDANTEGAGADLRRRALGKAYLEARQPKDAMRCLEPLLERGDPEASRMLVEIYRMDGQHQKAIQASENALAGLSTKERVQRLHEVLDLEQSADDESRVIMRAEEILAHDPTDERALQVVSRYFRRAKQFERLRPHLERASRVGDISSERRKKILSGLAALYANELRDRAAAIRTWQAVCNVDPDDLTAKWKLAVLMERESLWDELAELFEEILVSTPAKDEKIHVLRRLHEIHNVHRQSPGQALDALRRLHGIVPEDAEAREQFCASLLDTGAFLEAVPLLRIAAQEASDPATRLERLVILEDLLRGPLADPESALAIAEEIAQNNPNQQSALARVVELALRVQHWGAAIGALQRQADLAAESDTEAQADVLTRMGRILDERMGHTDRARLTFAKALHAHPNHTVALSLLTETHARLSMHADLVKTLQSLQKNASETAVPMYLRTIAETQQFSLRDPAAAAATWERLFEVDVSAIDALEHLERAAEEAGELRKQANYIELLVERSNDAESKALLLLKQAHALSELGDPNSAIECLRDVVDGIHHDHPDGLRELDRLLHEQGRQAERAPILRRMIRSPFHEAERADLCRELVQLFEETLDEPQNHRRALELWAQTEPTNSQPLIALATLLQREGAFEEALETRVRAETLLTAREAESIRAETLRIAEDNKVPPRHILEIAYPLLEKGNPEAHELVARMSTDPSCALEVSDTYEKLANGAHDKASRASFWLRTGHAAVVAGRPERGLTAFAHAAQHSTPDDAAHHQALDAIETTLNTSPAPELMRHAERIFEQLVGAAASERSQVEMHERAAELFEAHGPHAAAARHRLRACRIEPTTQRIEAAVMLAHQNDLVAEAVALLDSIVEKNGSLDIRMQAIEKLATPLEAEPALRRHIQQLFDEVAQRDQVLGQLANRWLSPELEDVSELLLGALADTLITFPPLAHDATAWEAAGLAFRQIGDQERAGTALRRAIDLGGVNLRSLDRLEELTETPSELDMLQRSYATWLADSFDAPTSELLMYRRAHILDAKLGLFGEAADVYQKLIPLVQRSKEPVQSLAHIDAALLRCLENTQRFSELIGHLTRVVGRTEEETQRIEFLAQIARTWQSEINNPWEAREAWARVLRANTEHREARAALESLADAGQIETGLLLLDEVEIDDLELDTQQDAKRIQPRTDSDKFEEYAPMRAEDTQPRSGAAENESDQKDVS